MQKENTSLHFFNCNTCDTYICTFDACQKSAAHIGHLKAMFWMFTKMHLWTI